MSVQEPTSFRLVATLALTGLLSGLVLVGIYLVTQPMILRNQAEAMTRAIFRVLPGTSEISTFVIFPVFYNPEKIAEKPHLAAIQRNGDVAAEEWVCLFALPGRITGSRSSNMHVIL